MNTAHQRIAIGDVCGWAQGMPGYPDYLNDLNAMHEAEKILNQNKRYDYFEYLEDIMQDCIVQNIIFATAAQRAKAFLKTIGKWEEAPSES